MLNQLRQANNARQHINWRWPSNPSNSLLPWYLILRRMAFWPLVLIGRSLSFAAVLGGFGYDEAVREWEGKS